MQGKTEQEQQGGADCAENRISALNDAPEAQTRKQQAEQAGKPQPQSASPHGQEQPNGGAERGAQR